LIHDNLYYLVDRDTDFIFQVDETTDIDFTSHFKKLVKDYQEEKKI